MMRIRGDDADLWQRCEFVESSKCKKTAQLSGFLSSLHLLYSRLPLAK